MESFHHAGGAQHQRIRIDLAYDGAPFSGWAKQPGRVTIQGCLEEALALILREPVQVTVAGRTDAGVHASAQTVHCDIPRHLWEKVPGRSNRLPAQALEPRLRGALSRILADAEQELHVPVQLKGLMQGSIAIHAVSEVSADFDARFSALGRRYQYLIADDALGVAVPTDRHSMWQVETLLDVEVMNEGAQRVLGLNDFLSFCKPRVGATTIRELRDFTFIRRNDHVIETRIEADAFCHNMVRSLVGSLVLVGAGERSLEWIEHKMKAPARDARVKLAPACGLSLAEIYYPELELFGAQAELTRAVREI
ncbi:MULTISPECIES: tRNA pseudouridine(38-40) synthase TruA [unclassified Rothia (in: high G+C Gram-positive bacteria)]|uniref:tRNA pseudouridine(38-40) synthase TruA n=1 Tax=unclassified Rothia (in: high G+C Gram-positive bacteria) TaxID=2689056 RepID=UPI00195D82A2|nr:MULTISPECIES: tRNA pseudouridine(38-40) synthase TruA [unclassified Rothia (in: high G+C Gram-positive bacteria)]MBM7051199.1 tRNA pseudouridine(38-40) synthase TruA [Rothia sp. ZJ1223]QRZ62106.1 tRNA pseudouridine(38-40) synthase TruA [Rothia sp. ZJ932]